MCPTGRTRDTGKSASYWVCTIQSVFNQYMPHDFCGPSVSALRLVVVTVLRLAVLMVGKELKQGYAAL